VVHTYAIRVGGHRVGTAVVHFNRSTLPTPETNLENALVRTIALGGALGVLLALGVAVVLSRWLTRPVVALTRAVGSMGEGDLSARVGAAGGTGELAELARAFDTMADTIEREERLRRTVVADAAHELRTPLAIIQANSELLADGSIDPTAQNLESLHDEVLRLGRIVEDLDTIALAEAAVLELRVRPLDLADVCRRTIAAFRPSFDEAGVELAGDVSSAPARIDPVRAGQVLGNLLTNALKFTRPGGSVWVRVTGDARSDTAMLTVTDSGIGIPPDELPFVFDRFWRGRQAGRIAGSGIGLAVVHMLVLAHGGTLEVASEQDAGTRFTVRFPAADVEATPRLVHTPEARGDWAEWAAATTGNP
jgi:two-component system sensor histidine kinase BaeS